MKKTILPICILLVSALGALGQGTINFSTRVSGTVVGHVYGLDFPVYVDKTGNTASETPAGTQTYLGALLTGSGYSAQLWGGTLGTPENLLVAIGSPSTFRTGATFGGTPVPQVLVVPFIPPGGSGRFQVRAWDNQSGFGTSWDDAFNRGVSALFEVSNLGDGLLNLPANMANFRSFNISNHTPEPSTYALFGLGSLGLWLFRRKKPAA